MFTSFIYIYRTPAQMSKLLLKMDQLMVTELRNQRAVGVLPTVANLHLLEDELPVMPFTDWNELLKFEQLLCSDKGTSVKQAFVNKLVLITNFGKFC